MAGSIPVRTDLAREADTGDAALSGVLRREWETDGVEECEVRITTEEASRALGKNRGRYLTLSVGRVWEDTPEVFRRKTEIFSGELKSFLPAGDGCVLLVGLGNRRITADAVGPMSVEHVLVTRHLEESQPGLFRELSLARTAALSPGVLGQTGIESADIIRSLVDTLHPGAVVAVDALASRSLARLATTVQITDAGIAPGSGVGNRRDALDLSTLGVPVCAVGVPTVVDAVTLAWDVFSRAAGGEGDFERWRADFPAEGLNFFVTPKETDEILKSVSALIGYGINLALHPSLDYEQMLSLIE